MNKNTIIIILVVVIVLLIGGYFIFVKKPASPVGPTGPAAPVTNQSTTPPVKCDSPPCLLPYFLECSASELSMSLTGSYVLTITVYGLEDNKCHYGAKVVDKDKNSQVIPGTIIGCRVPKEKVTSDTLAHFFGSDKEPGKENIKAVQDKIEADYCTKE